MNQLKIIWLSALFLTLTLLLSHGLYLPYVVALCGVSIALLLLPESNTLTPVPLDRFLLFSLIGFCLVPIFGEVLFPPLLIYPSNDGAYSFVKIGFAVLGVFGVVNLFKKTPKLFLWAALLVFVLLGAVVLVSPHPVIDVWNIHEACTNALVHGKNPYTIDIPNPYPVESQSTLTPKGMNAAYLPGIFIFMAVFSALGLDTRFAGVLALAGIAVLLFRLAKRSEKLSDFQKKLIPVLFLANPIHLFLIEQGWNEPIGVFFFLLTLFWISEAKPSLLKLTIAITGTLLSKQYFWPFVFLLFVWIYRARLFKFRQMLISLLPTLAVLVFFTALNWRNFWGSLYGLHFLKNSEYAGFFVNRWDSLSFTVYLRNMGGFDLTSVGTILVAGFYLGALYFLLKTEKLKSSSAFFMTLTLLMFAGIFLAPVSYFNYYFVAWAMICLLFVNCDEEHLVNKLKIIPRLQIGETTIGFLFTRILIISIAPVLSDVSYYQKVADQMSLQSIPYRDYSFEYPPLSLLFVLIPKLISSLSAYGDVFSVYRFWFQITFFAFDFFAFRWLQKNTAHSVGFAYLFLPLLLFPLWYDRFDLIIGLIVMMAAINLSNGKLVQSFGQVVIGGLIKIVPIIELMTFTGQKLKDARGFWNKRNLLFGFFFVICLILSFIFPNAWLQVYQYHSDRLIQAESIWATIDFAYRSITGSGDMSTFVSHDHGSYTVIPYLDLDLISKITMPLALAALSAFLFFFYRKNSFRKFHMLIPLLLYMTLSRVFSPQYLIWLVPLIGVSDFEIANKIDRWIFLLTILICGISTYLLLHYGAFVHVQRDLWMYLMIRNLSCVVMFGLLILKMLKPKELTRELTNEY